MRLLFPIVFGLIVFSTFVLPRMLDAQNYWAQLVAIAVSK